MTNLTEFLNMGGYAPFVWGAWGCAAISLCLFALWCRLRLKQAKTRLAKLEKLMGGR